MVLSQNNAGGGHFITRWLFRARRGSLRYAVDERTHDDVWVELGRYATKPEAEAGLQHMVSGGRDPHRMRIVERWRSVA
jgi:hypothetical protein